VDDLSGGEVDESDGDWCLWPENECVCNMGCCIGVQSIYTGLIVPFHHLISIQILQELKADTEKLLPDFAGVEARQKGFTR